MDSAPELFHYSPVPKLSGHRSLQTTKAATSSGSPFQAKIPLPDAAFPMITKELRPLMSEYGYLHRHPEYEICLFPADHGTFLIQDREYSIRPGDVFIVNANDIHQPILRRQRNQGAIATYFSPRLFGDAQECGDWLGPFMFASRWGANRVPADRRIKALIRELLHAFERKGPHWQLESRGILTHVLSIIASRFLGEHGASNAAENMRAAHRFGRVINYINEHLHESIEVATLYEVAHLSRSQFSVAFRSAFGMGVTAYVQQQRVSRAKRMLRSTSMTIAQIALSTGFDSGSFFTRVFKKYADGVSPLAYRVGAPS
jgi:AraC-like DNA-binding protein